MASKLPVTLLSGFLGTGKSTLLNHLLSNRNGLRMAVIVSNTSPITIDDEAIEGGEVILIRTKENHVEVSSGCHFWTVREDLRVEIRRLAETGRFDHVVIESDANSDPQTVAETFSYIDENGLSLGDVAELDTLVTVVDSERFLLDFESYDDLVDRDLGVNEDDHRNVVDVLVDQIEFANVVVLNKCDQLESESLSDLTRFINQLNPFATIITTEFGRVDVNEVLGTQSFQEAWSEGHPDWLAVPDRSEDSEFGERKILSFVLEERRPFHPVRLMNAMNFEDGVLQGVLRSKGYFWIATHNDEAFRWSQAGVSVQLDSDGPWMCTVDEADWPEDVETRENIVESMQEPFGDRRQQLVFIGTEFDEPVLRSRLEECLLTDEELSLPQEEWASWECPLPIFMPEDEPQVDSELPIIELNTTRTHHRE